MLPRDSLLNILQEFKKKHAEQYGILAIGVFGSVARDEVRENSDLDICVKTATPNPFTLVHIKEEIEKRVRARVDIIRLREKMNPYLRERIERDVIYV